MTLLHVIGFLTFSVAEFLQDIYYDSLIFFSIFFLPVASVSHQRQDISKYCQCPVGFTKCLEFVWIMDRFLFL